MKTQWIAVAMTASVLFGNAFAADEKTPSETQAVKTNLLSSNKLLGATIYGRGDQAVANVNTIVLNKQGEALFVIAGVGGLAGVGETEIVVPWNAVKFTSTKNESATNCRLEIPMSSEQLSSAPQLKAKDYAELADREWLGQNAKFYSAKAPTLTASPGELVCVRTVTDAAVKGQGQTDMGQLDAIMFDMSKGTAIYGIIGHDGVAGVGETYTPIPYKSLSFAKRTDGTYLVTTTATQDTLKTGPKVTPSEYPELQLKSIRDRIDG